MAGGMNYNASINLSVNANSAKSQLKDLQSQLQQISNMKINIGTGNLTADIEKASEAAMKLSAHLATATNPQTGNLDFTKFYTSIQKSGASLEDYGKALQNMGPAGQKAFVSLADSISKSEIPLRRTSKMVDKMWDGLKRTAGWQLQSSIIHGLMGSVQQAVGYAQDLNKSLTDIRIVTGQSSEQMASFAKEANKAAKSLSTTTTDYTNASLIYYQQGLSDAEVKARTETTIKMANATGTSAQTVSDQMTAIWNNFDNGTKSLTHYADVMTALGAATASSTDEIAEGLQKFAAISDTVGLSYEYAATALATITSTSRESADVVGNSLKTLFTRIQGLQLGETLDDGTTLNKYSTALAKVGISIKDSSGGLKDMDLILDEMGNKWETLARDEQMALAQTVAGVRQYTQLMTLMENWDTFKQNLNIANTSSGTLDAQATIYAESWEAASNRVRTSWEGLWDNLINSDSAIEVLDFVSNLVNGLDGITTSLGGAKGVLTTFGGLLTKIFAPNISKTIADTAYNIGMMLPGAEKRAEQKRKGMLSDLQNAMNSGHLDMGSYESKVRNSAISARLRESQIQAERERSMTDEEKLWDKEYAQQLEKNRELQIQNAQEIDAAANTRANLAIDEIGLDKLDSEYLTGGEIYKRMAEAEEKAYDDTKNYSAETRERAFKEAVEAEKEYYSKDRKKSTGKTVREVFNETFNQNQEFLKAFDTKDIEKAKSYIAKFAEQTDQSVESLDKALDEINTEEGKRAFLEEQAKALVRQNRDNVINNMDIDADEEGLSVKELAANRQKYRDYYDKLVEIEAKKQRGEELTDQEKAIINQRNKLGTEQISWSDAFTGAAGGLWSAVAALESLKSFADDPSLTSFAGLAMNNAMAFNDFNTLFKSIPGSIGKASSALSLGLIAFITTFDLIGEALDKWDNRFQDSAEQAATSASELQSAYNTNQSNHNQLLTTIDEYKSSEAKLRDITLSSKERAEAEYEHNRLVTNMIGEYNLQEGEYLRTGGQLSISQKGLDRITEESENQVNASRAAADQGAVNAKEKANEAEVERLRKQMTEASGKDGDIGNTLLKIGGGLLAGAGIAALATIAMPALAAAGGAIATGMGASGALAGLGLGGSLGIGALGSSTLGGILGGVGITGIVSTLLGARAEQEFEKANFADQALKITEQKKGDTNWLNSINSIMAEGFGEDQAKIIYQYRDSLEQLSSSMKAAELAGDAVAENAARNAVATNEAANASSQQSKIVEGATSIYEQAYEDQKKSLIDTFDNFNKQNKLDQADMAREALGLSNLEGFEWEDDDRSNRRLTYSYIDDSGKVQEGAVTYDSIIEAQSSKSGVAAANSYTDQMLQAYKDLKVATGDGDAAGGLFALLTGGDFDSATNKEITAAQDYLKTFQGNAENLLTDLGMSAEDFSEAYGMSAEDFVDSWTNYQTASQKLLDSSFSGNTGYREWQAQNQDLLDSISQDTGLKLYDNLNQISTLGGEDAGMAFLDGLSYILNSEGLEPSDAAAVMESLMALDWSSATIGTDITSIVSSLGGTIDTATAAWQNFVSAMMEASGAVPDFSDLLSQLTELIGLLGQVNPGDVIDDSLLSSLLEKFPEFRDLVMKQWDGNYKFIGSEEDLQNYQNRLNNEYAGTYQDMLNTADLLEQYTGEGGALEGFDGSKLTAEDLFNGDNAEALRNLLAAYTGKSSQEISAELSQQQGELQKEATELNQWSKDSGGQGVEINGKAVFRDENGNFVDADGNLVDEATRTTAEQEYLADQAEYNSAMSVIQSFVAILQNLLGMSPEEITQDANEQKASTYGTYSEFEEGVQSGDRSIVNEDGSYTEAGIKQLRILASTWEGGTAAVDQYNAALERQQAIKDEINSKGEMNITGEDLEELQAAEAVVAEAEAQMELAAAIGEVANARGIEAEILAQKISILKQDGDMANLSAKHQAELAAELIEQGKAIDKLKKNYKNWEKALNECNEGSDEWNSTMVELKKTLAKALNMKDFNKISDAFVKAAKSAGLLEKVANGDEKALGKLRKESAKLEKAIENGLIDPADLAGKSFEEIGDIVDNAFANAGGDLANWANNFNSVMDTINSFDVGELITGDAEFNSKLSSVLSDAGAFTDGMSSLIDTCATLGIKPKVIGPFKTPTEAEAAGFTGGQTITGDYPDGNYTINNNVTAQNTPTSADGSFYGIVYEKAGGGGSGGGGGGGGGGGQGPKKVANKRKSQTVKRYKKVDYKRTVSQRAKKSEENKKDYLYGESKIAQMEKINKLAQKEADITRDRIKESQKYLIEDRQNLIKYLQKYGFEAEFDADGFLSNYEEAWTKIYEEIAALYEDNELTKEEEEIEEELNIKLEELEGALEDYENSLEELASDIEAWEESMYEMFDSEIEQVEHKVQFKLELDEDSLTYIDYLIENLGDSAVRAIDKIELIAGKTDYLFNSIETAYQGVQDIYDLSDSPLHLFATGGADIDGLLTESQVEALRDQADSLQDFADQLREIRDTIQEQVAEVFDMWTEKVNNNISALEHYGSIMEYFKNIVDLTGNDIFGLSSDFVRNMESAQIDQSIDQMEANKAYYEELQEMRTQVEEELIKAQMSGDEERIAYWEEHLATVTEEMQTAQDAMLSSLESALTMISDQFTAAMEDAVEAFNESIYASGGLEGLSADYSLLREEADLMAEDYDKIYQLTKISRNINKTLDDTNIIAGKRRLTSLLAEINDLQESGVELSKYDLEYLEAKYQLYLAQIELENSQNDKDTVQLSRDSEGNWSYVYTTNEDKIDEAQQKYEDALYEMQNMNHEYLEEMSSSVIDLTQQMNEEIAALEISDFANLEEYNAKVEEIQQKYLAQIEVRESELNKAVSNNQDLYAKDWKAYSEMTGYKISADNEWIDNFRETTLGYLTESESMFSDFGDKIAESSQTLAEQLSTAAGSYFSQVEEALATYDSSIESFGSKISGTYKSIQDSSDATAKKTEDMATRMKDAFETVVNTVGTWQDTDGLEITEMLDKIATYLKDIFDAINYSANIKTDSGGPTIGQQEAVRLLNEGFEYNGEVYQAGAFGSWKFNSRGDLDVSDGKDFNEEGTNLVAYHAYLATAVQDALDAYYSQPNDTTKGIAEALIKKYWAYRSIIDRVYDPGEIEEPSIPTSLDTGGYTGEWGSEGRLAMLHQKELVLNANDTSNFLDALSISRDVINSMIEMNARASSFGLGDMIASSIKDTAQTIEQQVSITAEFPNVTDSNEIEEAFDNLINVASQYAYRNQ